MGTPSSRIFITAGHTHQVYVWNTECGIIVETGTQLRIQYLLNGGSAADVDAFIIDRSYLVNGSFTDCGLYRPVTITWKVLNTRKCRQFVGFCVLITVVAASVAGSCIVSSSREILYRKTIFTMEEHYHRNVIWVWSWNLSCNCFYSSVTDCMMRSGGNRDAAHLFNKKQLYHRQAAFYFMRIWERSEFICNGCSKLPGCNGIYAVVVMHIVSLTGRQKYYSVWFLRLMFSVIPDACFKRK